MKKKLLSVLMSAAVVASLLAGCGAAAESAAPAATEAAKKWREENGGSYWKGKKIPPEGRANMKAAQQERGTSVRVLFPNGHTEDFTTMLDASKKTGDGTGSVKYSMEHGTTTKRGYKYMKL